VTAKARGRIDLVDEPTHVTVSGAVNGRYLVAEKRPGGELTLVPDTSIEAVRERQGTEPMSPEQFAETFGKLPTDDEG
jgi:hypothetical protein